MVQPAIILSKYSIFYYSYDIIGHPGVSGYNTALPPGPPSPNHPVGHSFHPLSQPAGVSVQPPQYMAPGFQMFGKFNLHYHYNFLCLMY